MGWLGDEGGCDSSLLSWYKEVRVISTAETWTLSNSTGFSMDGLVGGMTPATYLVPVKKEMADWDLLYDRQSRHVRDHDLLKYYSETKRRAGTRGKNLLP